MITIYVDSFNTAAKVCKFIQNSLNDYGCVSLGDILNKAGYPRTTFVYDNILFYQELKELKMPTVPDYVDKTKPYALVIPSDRYTMMFNCVGKIDSAAREEILNAADKTKRDGIIARATSIPKAVPKPTNYLPEIKNVKFNGPATIVFWADGTKTVVKCQNGDDYSEEVGLAMCIVKKAFGNTSKYNDIFKKWCPSYDAETDDDEYFSEAYKQFRNYVLKTFNDII